MDSTPTLFSTARENIDWRARARELGLDLETLPAHIAVIMDGNGRWARRHKRPREFGHRQGVEAVRRAVRAAHSLGIGSLSLYSFSSENWKRPATEVAALMGLLRRFINADLSDLKANNVHVRIIGERRGLDSDIAGLIARAEDQTAANTGLNLVIAFNYGARDEIVRAARALAHEAAAGRLDPDTISEDTLAARLDTAPLPDPDLLIRTSGEQRISNFLVWQCAYSEFVFQDILWPDYREESLLEAIRIYQGRERRFGGRPGDAADVPRAVETAPPSPANDPDKGDPLALGAGAKP